MNCHRTAARPLATRRWRRRPAPWSQSDAFKCERDAPFAVIYPKSTPCIGALNRGWTLFSCYFFLFFSLSFHYITIRSAMYHKKCLHDVTCMNSFTFSILLWIHMNSFAFSILFWIHRMLDMSVLIMI